MHTQTFIRETLQPLQPGEKVKHPAGCPIHRLFERDEHGSGILSRITLFAFGLLAYAMFFGTILYAIGFTTGLGVPKNINSGSNGDILASMLINGAMLMLFVVQHTVMARPAFKKVWTKIIPVAIERSIFVAAASACLMLLFWQWRPMTQLVLWDLRGNPWWNHGLTGLALFGYAIVFLSSFMVSHFDLFGLRQVWAKLLNRPCQPIAFRLTGLYHLVRHPLMVGFLIAFWSTPWMTLGHLFFAVMTTGYIFFGTWIEEQDLVAHFGETYRKYQRTVRGFVPLPKR